MKRIFYSLLLAGSLGLTASTSAQTLVTLNNTECSNVDFSGTYSEDFQTGGMNNFFGPGWSKATSGSNGYLLLNAAPASQNWLYTPTYKDPTNPLFFKFSIGGSAMVNSFNVYYQIDPNTTPVLLGTVNAGSNNVGTQQCFRIENLGIPFNTPFRLAFRFNTSNNGNSGAGTIEFDNFFLRGVTLNAFTLPVKFGAFTAKSSNGGVNLNWTIDAEENTRGYEVERSSNGSSYTMIGSVDATGARSYAFTDARPIADGYYRIKAVDFDGKFGYSSVLRVKGGEASVVVKAFFNNNTSLVIQHDQAPVGSRISVTTADGRLVRSVLVGAGAQQTTIDVAAVKPGLLLVRFENANGQTETLKVVKP